MRVCEVLWCEGAPGPSFSFWVSGRGRMCDPILIRNPQRFGWEEPGKLADFKAFAARFAAAAEQEASDGDAW